MAVTAAAKVVRSDDDQATPSGLNFPTSIQASEAMWRVYALIGLVWLALAPPLFTGGACTQEYEQATEGVLNNESRLRTPEAAAEYFRSSGLPVSSITPERCRESKPRFLNRCGTGTVVVAKVPVKNLICRTYRDSSVAVYLEYDEKGRPLRINTDMAPFKSLPIPGTSRMIHWGR